MYKFKADKIDLKHQLAIDLGKTWVDVNVDPGLIAGGVPLAGEVALQNSLYVYGLISTEADLVTAFTDSEMAARCRRFGISWTRCTGINDIYRCVQWAMSLQDRNSYCQVRAQAA